MGRIIETLAASTLALGTYALFGCAVDANAPTVSANAAVVNRDTTGALSTGVLEWMNGTYTGCTIRSGSWSLAASGNPVMDYTALSVVENNTACVLKVTALVTSENSKTTYTATTPITIGGSYQASPSTFITGDGGAGTNFYGNAEMTPSDYSGHLTVTVLFSDNPNLATGTVLGTYFTVTSSAVTQSITSPNYTLDLVTGAFAVGTDNNFVVQSFTGNAQLDLGSVAGNSYYVDPGTLAASPTFAQLDTAYQAAIGASQTTAISGAPVTINTAAFGFTVGTTSLSSNVYRTIVIQRLVSGVPSYQTFRIGFSHP